MNCDDTLVSRYLDGDLDAASRERVERHLDECETCRGRLETYRSLGRAIGRLPSRIDPPGALRARLDVLRFDFERRRSSRARRVRGALISGACVAALLALGLSMTLRTSTTVRASEELVADHLQSVPDVLPAQVTTDDPNAIMRFFDHRVPFQPVAPELPGAHLLGGRVCKIRGQLTQLLFYRRENRILSLYVASDSLGVRDCERARQHEVCSARRGERTLTVVAQLPPDELRRLLEEARL